MASQEFRKSLEVVREFEAPPLITFQAFKAHTWVKCGGKPFEWFCWIAKQGDPITSVGQERVVGCIVHEQILSVKENEEIIYTVSKNFPAKAHKGRVSFATSPENMNRTILTWHVDYTPYACCNWIIFIFVSVFFPIFLMNLKGEVRKRMQTESQNIAA